MKLKPLKQWFCDTCGDVIQRPEDGWIEWLRDDDHRVHSFRICHHAKASPRRNASREGCYAYGNSKGRQDLHLDSVLGHDGLAYFLSFVDVGAIHDKEGTSVPGVKDLRNWTDTLKRLHLPLYEEARRHFQEAERDGFYAGDNEVAPYTQDKLERVIGEYEE